MKTNFKFLLSGILVLILAVGYTGVALAVHDLGLFELDRNATDEGGGGDDWATLYGGGGSAAEFTGIIEDTMGTNPFGTVGTQFQAGGSKDDLDISPGGATGQNWKWDPGEPLDKDDITNAYAGAYVNTTDTGDNNVGDLIVYFGLDRYANNGSAQVGFWFLQDPTFGLTTTPSGGGYLFSGHHVVGDVLVQSNFTQGGVIDTISVYEWVGSGGSDGTLNLVFNAQDCLSPGLSDDPACATVNQGDTPSPWPFTPKFGTPGTFPQGSFFEGGINITRLVPDAGCFTGFLAETRSSTPFDSRLKDFAFGNFELCSIAVTKNGDSLSKVGDEVDYSITVENTGAITLYKDDISDTLLGDLTGDVSCGASLAPGATCTINASRTVLGTDPDPLSNTVIVVYNNKDDFSGTAVSDSDDHSVNLFQPSISLTKTGTELSKIGDPASWVITLTNTSSDDTPDLECTITDETLGINKSVTLASGEKDVTARGIFAVPEGASDPMVNTASASCSPVGFPNVIDTSASHSTNLFQPSINLTKTGTELSKVGDLASWVITLTNTSSADTPDLECTITDPTLGINKSVTLASGEKDVTARGIFAIPTTASDPFENTASATCSPKGFPNVLTATASHQVNLFQPSISLTKTGTELTKVGDPASWVITLTNTSSADTPDLECTITDEALGINKSVTLASGEKDVTARGIFAVLEGSPDPIENTASATCSPKGFPNVLTATASHSTNLFQPAIAIAKDGDELSKVGDPVDYTITLSNNSSDDTPDLNCVATDSLLGVVFNGVLPLGNTELHPSYTVQEGDPDPLVNSVSMTCNVAGFPNVLNAGPATHSTNLFQPGVEVIKGGPSTAARGDTITYTYTINNLSSDDSPDLLLASVLDDVVGDLTAFATAAGCDTLGYGGICNFMADYTIQFDDPNPLVNVVTVLYHPEGFPNDITDDDQHSLDIPILGCTPGFWQGGAGVQLWDEPPTDPQWVYVGSQPFYTDDFFNDFFNLVTDPRLDGQTMLEIISNSGGIDNSAEKAARDMVAAYLNESAFPVDFPADSLTDLENMWYAAVNQALLGDDSGYDDFHNLVANWNNPAPPGYCPLP